MKIGRNEVEYVANLARLQLDNGEIDEFAQQLSDILLYVDKLSEVDTDNVEPLAHAVEMNNAFRDDKVLRKSSKEAALANAPDKDDDYFKVPRII